MTASTGDIRSDNARPSSSIHTLPTPDGDFSFGGTLIGFATSQRTEHAEHDTPFMEAGAGRCSACRWFEVRIFTVDDDEIEPVGGTYVVHTHGRSVVPDEVQLCRVYVTSAPFEVVSFLTVHHQGNKFIPLPSTRALAQAARWDAGLKEAYVVLNVG